MSQTSIMDITAQQKFSETAHVVNLVTAVDFILDKLNISESCFRTPSSQSDRSEKVAGLTNTYLKPTRISRKVLLGNIIFFYGRKFNLMPEAFETVSFDTPENVLSFAENRIRTTLTDYISIHKDNLRLNIDIQNGKIISIAKMGFSNQFPFLSDNAILTVGNLEKMIQGLLEMS